MARCTPKRIVEESVRSSAALNADADGIRLYDMVRELKITPVQAVARYFCHGKGHYRVRRDYEGLLKILALLGECDWEYDPAVKVNEGCDIKDVRERWVQWDRDNLNTQTTEIRCTEDVVERFLRPLLGETFNVASFMQRLVEQGPTPEAAEELELAVLAAGAQPLAAHRRPTTEEQGDKGSDRTYTARGETQAYLLRRLARDAPEVLERVKAGEFRSARAAAIEAGIIRPVPTVRLVDDPQRVADAIRRHLSPEQIIKLAEALLA
jgi:hypothetical protein